METYIHYQFRYRVVLGSAITYYTHTHEHIVTQMLNHVEIYNDLSIKS